MITIPLVNIFSPLKVFTNFRKQFPVSSLLQTPRPDFILTGHLYVKDDPTPLDNLPNEERPHQRLKKRLQGKQQRNCERLIERRAQI